jgi:hypothetical protein
MKTNRDWVALAKAHGIDAAGRDLDRLVGGLQAVENVFRPLADALPPAEMPAVSFRAVPEGEE